jgi:hypothetical protein
MRWEARLWLARNRRCEVNTHKPCRPRARKHNHVPSIYCMSSTDTDVLPHLPCSIDNTHLTMVAHHRSQNRLARLPEEVLEYILSYALLPSSRPKQGCTSNRCSVLLVSKQFYRLAQPALFRDLVISSESSNDAIVTVLERNPALAYNVRSVRVTLPEGIEAFTLLARILAPESQQTKATPINDYDGPDFIHSPSAPSSSRRVLNKLDITISSNLDIDVIMQRSPTNTNPMHALGNALRTWPDTCRLVVRTNDDHISTTPVHFSFSLVLGSVTSLLDTVQAALADGILRWSSLVRPSPLHSLPISMPYAVHFCSFSWRTLNDTARGHLTIQTRRSWVWTPLFPGPFSCTLPSRASDSATHYP